MDVFNHYLPWTYKRLSLLPESIWQQLFSPSENVEQDQTYPITNLMVLLYQKITNECDLSTFKKRASLIRWYETYGKSIFNIEELETKLNHQTQKRHEPFKTNGVNLVGYSRGRLGLGEDLRAYAALLKHKGIAFSIVHIGHPTDDPLSFSSAFENGVIFDKSIFFINAIEAAKLLEVVEDLSATFGYTTIIPPWELEYAPGEWAAILDSFDEVWGISHFTTKALSRIHASVKYSAPVVLPFKYESEKRKKYTSPFRFLFIFDAGSYIERKNPLATVRAFQLAFAKDENVELVLKVSNSSDTKHWEKVKLKALSDTRIKIVDKLLTSAELEQLWDSANCYVSLHRSEGFGRTVAEALVRKLPVVATAYSGSNDLFPDDYPLLVEFNLVKINKGEYPSSTNATWADPNIKSASALMRYVFEYCETEQITKWRESGAEHVQQNFVLHSKSRPLDGWNV